MDISHLCCGRFKNYNFFNFFYNTWKFGPFYHLLLTPPPPLPLLGTTNLISLWIWLLVVLKNIIDPRYYDSLWCTMQHFDISIRFKLITTIALVAICHHMKIPYYSWAFSSLCTLHPCDIYFITRSLYLLISLTYFTYSPIPMLWKLPVCSISMVLSVLY